MLTRSQLLLVGGAVALAAALLTLPSGVLRNADKPGSSATATRDGATAGKETQPSAADAGASSPASAAGVSGSTGATPEHPHRELTAADRADLTRLRATLAGQTGAPARATAAASLAARFAQVQVYDSAGYYYEEAARIQPGPRYQKAAADQYFEAFGFAATPQRGQQLSSRAEKLYQQVLEATPNDLDAKTNLALLYVASPAPMRGILLLRDDVLKADPTNAKALYNLGTLQLRTNQLEKAVASFTKLVAAHPEHVNGTFYLGVALGRSGDKTGARKALEHTLTLSQDPGLRASVEQELSQLH